MVITRVVLVKFNTSRRSVAFWRFPPEAKKASHKVNLLDEDLVVSVTIANWGSQTSSTGRSLSPKMLSFIYTFSIKASAIMFSSILTQCQQNIGLGIALFIHWCKQTVALYFCTELRCLRTTHQMTFVANWCAEANSSCLYHFTFSFLRFCFFNSGNWTYKMKFHYFS